MELVKKAKEYTIYKKRSGRFAIKGAQKKWINGDEKAKILAAEKLIKLVAPKPKAEPEQAADAATEATAGEA
ncbi:MAG: hypothetical protein R3A11_00490 [Bdellovibrionota bacterium]